MSQNSDSTNGSTQPVPASLGDKLFEVCITLSILIVGAAVVTGVFWGLIKLLGWVWRAAEISFSYLSAIGWIIAVPLAALAIYEAVSRFKPTPDAATGASAPGAPPSAPKRGRTRGLLCAGSAAVIMSGQLCLNIAAGRIETHWQSRQQHTTEIYKNHDLAKLVGQCIRLAILRHADRLARGDERAALESIAAIAPAKWSEMTDTGNGKQPDPRVVALADARLTEFIREPNAEALHQAEWNSLLTDWRAEASATAITDPTLKAAAATIAKDFGITLREALKADFEKGGKAWAAMQLDIAHQLLNRTPVSMSVGNPEVSAALAEVKSLLADDAMGLPGLRRTLLDARQAQDNHAREVVARFDRLEFSLQQIQGSVDAVRDGVVSIQGDTTTIRQGMQENSKLLTEMQSFMAEIRRSPANWRPGRGEPLSVAEVQALEADYHQYLSARLAGDSLPYIKAHAPLRYRAWRRGAEADNSMAQVLVSLCLWFGMGVAPNHSESLTWCERAADQGNAQGLFILGVFHRDGDGGAPKSPANAARLFDAAAATGDPRAMAQIGLEYRWGNGGRPMDKKLAMEWLNRAIDKGDTSAMCDVARMQNSGELGKDGDSLLSEQLYRRAAEAGNQVAKGILAGRALGASLTIYVSAESTADTRAQAVGEARKMAADIDSLSVEALLEVLNDTKLQPVMDQLTAKPARDPMRLVFETVVEALVTRFRSADLQTRERLIVNFSRVAGRSVATWSAGDKHNEVALLWREGFADIDVFSKAEGDRSALVEIFGACIPSLYAVGYRDDATALADKLYTMTDEILKERPWEYYVRSASIQIGWNAGESLLELGETTKAQQFLRRAWNMVFWMDGRDDLIDKYAVLPRRGEQPPNVAPEDSEYFKGLFPSRPEVDTDKPESDADARVTGGLLLTRFDVLFNFGGVRQSVHLYVHGGQRGYKLLQDQFVYFREHYQGLAHPDVLNTYRRFNKAAVDNAVDFRDLCKYALGDATQNSPVANEKFDKILRNEYAVILLRGKNTSGDQIYAYVKLGLRDMWRLLDALKSGGNFSPVEFGEVLAAGLGDPPDQVGYRLSIKYPMLEEPRVVHTPKNAAPDAQQPRERQEERWKRFYDTSVAVLNQAEENYSKSQSEIDRTKLARAFFYAADQAMFVSRWEEAISWARRSIELDPKLAPSARVKLATSLLFTGDYNEAMVIFREHWADEEEGRTVGEWVYEEFQVLEMAEITHPDIARLKAELGDPPGVSAKGDADGRVGEPKEE